MPTQDPTGVRFAAGRGALVGRLTGRICLVAYLSEESPESERKFYERRGFDVLTKTRRGWTRD